ncbi:MAG: hypothetical protein JST54_18945 [Deltaproteobacteria bacterium]|nr:hypothetical protein [Deltaproteobacteria bacterium]
MGSRSVWLGLAAAAALGAGCAHTQTPAEAAQAQADDAQKRAASLQSESAKENQLVAQKQSELSAAQGQFATANANAQDAQKNAISAREEQLKDVKQQQAKAASGLKAEQKALATEPTHVSGQLTTFGRGRVYIVRHKADPLVLKVTPNTEVTLDGRPASVASLPQGSKVEASYKPGLDLPHATRIEASSPSSIEPGKGMSGSEKGTSKSKKGTQGTESCPALPETE